MSTVIITPGLGVLSSAVANAFVCAARAVNGVLLPVTAPTRR